jgi:hypothetical protein
LKKEKTLRRSVDADFLPFLIKPFEFHEAVNFRKNGIVFPQTHVVAGMKYSADLPNDNGTGVDFLAAIYLDAPSLGIAVSSISGAPLSLLVCHNALRLNGYFPDLQAG